eukprot:CAMPEP_0196728786 /NCGR_PEP_ID=MMETSP1091-20130531/9366_1 /TAXON_ID=302021 /ORGANISM="Rhodomonas sp., Strain CCMP768" /LENGTH=84 /DNA_ID=CAMNT_0042071581 /DNA_START=36 /DNA_END=290 /DNA_ORIENTATION=+
MLQMLLFSSLSLATDGPYVWQDSWRSDMPPFFSTPDIDSGVFHNVFDNDYYSLDSDPVPWHITEPVDPTAYRGEYIGQVVGDLY